MDSSGRPADPTGTRQLDITLSCTNGNLSGMREQRLTFHDGAPDAGRRFDVRASLSTKRVRRWTPGNPASAFVQGLEIRITVGEQRFAQLSLDRPGRAMDRIFACYVPITGFVQIVLLSAIAGAILRCGEPCPGNHPLAR
ncbi:type VI secretion system baseplate subunit TssF [Burkholderia multivorans]|uniref:type VI secretion system baseplate subunit TssF n=1 Tax=Burkholderia multivorans TaxID=87883 RepID=UPI001FC85A28|nr:type VI secretion system baseplate subunit TssF [Burkholderia multivorans]